MVCECQKDDHLNTPEADNILYGTTWKKNKRSTGDNVDGCCITDVKRKEDCCSNILFSISAVEQPPTICQP